MKKYFIFGFISGVVISLLYPAYNVLSAFSQYYGISEKSVSLLAAGIYAVIVLLIWIKLKSKFSIKNLIELCVATLIGIFAVVTLCKLGINRFESNPSMDISGGYVSANVAFEDAFNFKEVHILIRYAGQLMMQILPYIVACSVCKRIENKKFIKTGKK